VAPCARRREVSREIQEQRPTSRWPRRAQTHLDRRGAGALDDVAPLEAARRGGELGTGGRAGGASGADDERRGGGGGGAAEARAERRRGGGVRRGGRGARRDGRAGAGLELHRVAVVSVSKDAMIWR